MEPVNATTPFLSNRTYNVLKLIAQIILPAAATLYFGLASIWHLPAVEQVVGTITVVDAVLGSLLGISTKKYNASPASADGQLFVTADQGGTKNVSIELAQHPDDLVDAEKFVLKVVKRYE